MEVSSGYSSKVCGLHTICVAKAKLGTRHACVLWRLLNDQKIGWVICFDVSRFMLVDNADAVDDS